MEPDDRSPHLSGEVEAEIAPMKTVTIYQIAKRLKLAPSTVSRALRNSDLIQPKTRALIVDTAMQMGYLGASLRARSKAMPEPTKMVFGVIFALKSQSAIYHSPISTRYLEGITIEADALGALVTVHVIRAAERGKIKQHRDLTTTLEQAGCNLLLFQNRHAPDDVIFLSRRFPSVSLTWNYPGVALDVVVPHDWEGILRMVDLLADHGHQRLAWIGDNYPSECFERRLAALVQGALRRGLDLSNLTIFGDELYRGGDQMDSTLLLNAVRKGTTAFVCANDRTAHQVVQRLHQSGIRVPEEVSVTGFDHMGIATANHLQLTTFDPNFVDLGRLAVRLGMMRLNGVATHQTSLVVAGQTITGETAAAAPASSALR